MSEYGGKVFDCMTPLLHLNIFNKIWISYNFPSNWRKATTIPIPKPGKNPPNPIMYCPVVLTRCMCKTIE